LGTKSSTSVARVPGASRAPVAGASSRPPHPASRGRRLYHFPDGPSESPIGARERIAFVSAEAQDAYERREWNVRVEDVVRTGFAGGVWVTEPLSADEERRVDEAIDLLGIGHLRMESILEVSTGEARKALLARALAPRPRVLLLDEFCNGLDAGSRHALLEAVSRIARSGTPIVFATHRHDEIVPEVTHAAVLESGRIVRVELATAMLPAYGFDVVPGSESGVVEADVLVGQDDQPRAIRFVNLKTDSRRRQ